MVLVPLTTLVLLLLLDPVTPVPVQDPDSEVEVFKPESTNKGNVGDYDDYYKDDDDGFSFPSPGILRVLVLPIPSFGFNASPRNPFARPGNASNATAVAADEEDAACGLICRMLELLGVVSRGAVSGGLPFGDIEPTGKNKNSTYETKILDDGSVVRINKTVISDIDEKGNGFVFHRSVYHATPTKKDENEIEDFRE